MNKLLLLAARWVLGVVFLYTGLSKALHPVEFLKLVRQYDLVQPALALNLIAAGVPWFEVFCGLLLMLGLAVRGTALVLLGLLAPFTALVIRRALELHAAGAIPFCAVKFDCGCGTGEVLVCRKVLENAALILVATVVILGRQHPCCLWPRSPVHPPGNKQSPLGSGLDI
ncbi:MAG: DoxX family protein [Verrucomicrobia bacterium]|nr:DoxX family protein [Verrucomicrobiota bacterium]